MQGRSYMLYAHVFGAAIVFLMSDFTSARPIDAKVLELRSEYGEPQKDLNDPSKYIHFRYYEAAAQ